MSYGSDANWQKWVLNEDKALPLLKAAWDAGIQTWDTANVYSNVVLPVNLKHRKLTITGHFRAIDCESYQEVQYSKGKTRHFDEMLLPRGG